MFRTDIFAKNLAVRGGILLTSFLAGLQIGDHKVFESVGLNQEAVIAIIYMALETGRTVIKHGFGVWKRK